MNPPGRLRHLLPLFAVASFLWGNALAADLALRATSKLVLEASAASLAGGTARLTTTALRLQGGSYVGNYQLKVFPYSFKNETGTLSVIVSDESLRKLSAGKPVSFTGTAQTSGTGRSRAVSVIVTPAAAGRPTGKLTISVATENGALVFAPAYTLTGG